jgi:hypothetical protein
MALLRHCPKSQEQAPTFHRSNDVEDRNCLLRGLTLHGSGRESDGRIAQEL